jgi:hypothetical protein
MTVVIPALECSRIAQSAVACLQEVKRKDRPWRRAEGLVRVGVVNGGDKVDLGTKVVVGRVQESDGEELWLCTMVKWQEWVRPESDGGETWRC